MRITGNFFSQCFQRKAHDNLNIPFSGCKKIFQISSPLLLLSLHTMCPRVSFYHEYLWWYSLLKRRSFKFVFYSSGDVDVLGIARASFSSFHSLVVEGESEKLHEWVKYFILSPFRARDKVKIFINRRNTKNWDNFATFKRRKSALKRTIL